MKNFSKIAEAVNYLLEQKLEFALYRLPNNDAVSLMIDLGLNKETGFVLQPFNSKEKSQIISEDLVFSDTEISIENIKENTKNFKASKEVEASNLACHFLSQTAYETYVAETAALCAGEKLDKSVAARIKSVTKTDRFNLGTYFVKMLRHFC